MANIKKHLENIKGALFGKDVRSSIHDGIDAINKEVEGTTEKQNKLGEQFKNLVINEGNSNAEVAASRGSHDWLPDRLDNFDSQLEHIAYFITPEMYGAIGDGVSDDTEALKRLFNIQNVTINFSKEKVYKITNEIYIDSSNVKINGNNSTIKASNTHIFNISNKSSNIEINDLRFENEYINDFSNACIRTSKTNNRCGFGESTKDIKINNCKFNGGVFGVVLNSATNVKIKDCYFGSHNYIERDEAGGYGVLIQSSYNVEVTGCENIAGIYSRHFCYISVDKEKEMNKHNINIKVLNNYIDFTNVKGVSGAECGMVVRESQDVQIFNNYFFNTIGGIYINLTFEEGITKNIKIKDNHFKGVREIEGKFTRASIGFVGTYSTHNCIIENNYFEDSVTTNVIAINNCFNITMKNNKITTNSNKTRVYLLNNVVNFLIDGDSVEGVRNCNIRYEGSTSSGRISNFYKDDYFGTTEFASGILVKTTRDIQRLCRIKYDDYDNSVSITRNFESLVKSVDIEDFGFTVTFNFIDVNTFNFNIIQVYGEPSILSLRTVNSETNSVSFNVTNLNDNKGSKQWNIYI